MPSTLDPEVKMHFIRAIIDSDLATGRHQAIVTRFPPEPNGFLHIGHAKAICINFGLADDYGGVCHLRFDDTNPAAEEQRYVDAIVEDLTWLGMVWHDTAYYTSDYYEQLYSCACLLIEKGLAYVDDSDVEMMRQARGSLTEPGQDSPCRNRPITDNLELFAQMRAGHFAPGQYTLRAKIDMQSGNMNLRDPVIYRIIKQAHPRTGDQWCIYPLYDFAHALSDAIEGITHSLCSLEFQDHRPLYDWFIRHCELNSQPQQIEFSRLNLSHTLTSKRKLKQLVKEQWVDGWDDPRLPTLRGMRRRGYPAQSIIRFCNDLGVSKQDSVIDYTVLESVVRSDLNHQVLRRMVVLDPIKVTITNYGDGREQLEVPNHPGQPERGRRPLFFSSDIYIDRSDYQDQPTPGFYRLTPGGTVRLLNAYVIRADHLIRDNDGRVVEIHASYLPETLGGKKPADGHKVKGTIHWVAVDQACPCEVRVYDRLFTHEDPAALECFIPALNPQSLVTYQQAMAEPILKEAMNEETFQFQRLGYFCADRYDHGPEKLVFNQIVSLRESSK